MKEFRFRIILIVGALALSIYLLYPTYVDYQNSNDIEKTLEGKREEITTSNPDLGKTQVDRMLQVVEDSIITANPDITKNREKRI